MATRHDIMSGLPELPDSIRRDLSTLCVDRCGSSDQAFMRTEAILGHVDPRSTYRVGWDGLAEIKRDFRKNLPTPTQPDHAIMDGIWQSVVAT